MIVVEVYSTVKIYKMKNPMGYMPSFHLDIKVDQEKFLSWEFSHPLNPIPLSLKIIYRNYQIEMD